MVFNVRASIGKKKGKFIKAKVKRAIEIATQRLPWNAKKQHANSENESPNEPNLSPILVGRRIVELNTMAKELWCQDCDLTLSLKNVSNERKCGFASILKVACTNCKKLTSVHTNKLNAQKRCHDVNLKAAIAIIDAGIGEGQMNTICSSMNIPSVSGTLLKRHERAVGPAIEAVAKESCRVGIKQEKQLSIANDSEENNQSNDLPSTEHSFITPNPDMNENITPISNPPSELIASFDAGWQKRGTGHAYNSLSGHSSLIGYHTGKVLSYCTRSKRCRKCESGYTKDHDCRRNFSGSAKAMEPDMAVQLVNRNELLTDENSKISVLIGDDDSCTIAAVRREAGEQIEKWSDFNHAHKALKNALYAMKLPPTLIKYFSHCFSCAVKQNKGDAEGVQASLKNVVPHAFGEHDNCSQWCGYESMGDKFVHKNLPRGKPLSDASLRQSMSKLFERFAANAHKLAPCASSQANESFNSIVASKHPKSRFYGGSESFDTRVAAAVGQKNLGTEYIVSVNELISLSPGTETQKYRKRKDQIREAQAVSRGSVEYKRRRLFGKNERSTKNAGISKREGITYLTESGLSNVSDLLQNQSPTGSIDFSNCCTVIFDLETTGLHKTSEICQISACTEKDQFNSYIIPSKGMTPGAAQVTGLKIANGEMYLKDVRLDTVPARSAFAGFLKFLQSQGKPVILVAHNGFRFDAPRILHLAADLGAMKDFASIVVGFADTLHVFKEKLPDRKINKQKFTQEALAADYLDPSTELPAAHNAINDVQILMKLLQSLEVDEALITRHTRSVSSLLEADNTTKRNAINKASLETFTEISDHMRGKIAKAGIDESLLKRAFDTGGDEGVYLLLGEDIGGKPRVTKTKKVIDKILGQLRTM